MKETRIINVVAVIQVKEKELIRHHIGKGFV